MGHGCGMCKVTPEFRQPGDCNMALAIKDAIAFSVALARRTD